jgi:hypothetical protein
MQTDVKSKALAATGALGNGARTRIKSIFYNATTGGTITVNDGNGGTLLLSLTVPTSAVNTVWIPGEGILSQNEPYITFTTFVGNVTVFYG